MRDSNEAIERVLAGLREVETPAGMERRVLARMEERTAARSGARPRPRMGYLPYEAWRPAMGWVWAGAVAAMVFAGTLMLRPARRPRERIAAAPVAQSVRVAEEQRRMPEILPLREAQGQNDLHAGSVQQVPPVEVAVAEKAEEERGFPAPPMPLTEEEKLLLRVAHRVDPQELTPLNAEARARQEAEFDEEFMEFFAVPETVTEEKQMDPTESDKGETR